MRLLRCPYCESENLIGKVWLTKRTDTIAEYEKQKKELGQRVVPYVFSKTINRLILIACLILAGMLVAYGIFSSRLWVKRDSDGKMLDKTMIRLHDEGKYEELCEYLDQKELFTRVPPAYAQSALLYRHYDDFLTYRMSYLSEPASEWDENLAYLSMTVSKAAEVLRHDIGVYSGDFPENEKQYREYEPYILAFLEGTLGMPKEDVDWLRDPESRWHSYEGSADRNGMSLEKICRQCRERVMERERQEN